MTGHYARIVHNRRSRTSLCSAAQFRPCTKKTPAQWPALVRTRELRFRLWVPRLNTSLPQQRLCPGRSGKDAMHRRQHPAPERNSRRSDRRQGCYGLPDQHWMHRACTSWLLPLDHLPTTVACRQQEPRGPWLRKHRQPRRLTVE